MLSLILLLNLLGFDLARAAETQDCGLALTTDLGSQEILQKIVCSPDFKPDPKIQAVGPQWVPKSQLDPKKQRLEDGFKLVPCNGLRLEEMCKSGYCWSTTGMQVFLNKFMEIWKRDYAEEEAPAVVFTGRQNGGSHRSLTGSGSHLNGLDVDFNTENYTPEKLWKLANTLYEAGSTAGPVSTNGVIGMYLNATQVAATCKWAKQNGKYSKQAAMIIRDWAGHETHTHVRLGCPVFPEGVNNPCRNFPPPYTQHETACRL